MRAAFTRATRFADATVSTHPSLSVAFRKTSENGVNAFTRMIHENRREEFGFRQFGRFVRQRRTHPKCRKLPWLHRNGLFLRLTEMRARRTTGKEVAPATREDQIALAQFPRSKTIRPVASLCTPNQSLCTPKHLCTPKQRRLGDFPRVAHRPITTQWNAHRWANR